MRSKSYLYQAALNKRLCDDEGHLATIIMEWDSSKGHIVDKICPRCKMAQERVFTQKRKNTEPLKEIKARLPHWMGR